MLVYPSSFFLNLHLPSDYPILPKRYNFGKWGECRFFQPEKGNICEGLKGTWHRKRKSWLGSGSAAVDLGMSVLIIVPLSSLFQLDGLQGFSACLPQGRPGNMPALQSQCSLHVSGFFHLSDVLTTRPLSDNVIIPDSKFENEVHQQ